MKPTTKVGLFVLAVMINLFLVQFIYGQNWLEKTLINSGFETLSKQLRLKGKTDFARLFEIGAQAYNEADLRRFQKELAESGRTQLAINYGSQTLNIPVMRDQYGDYFLNLGTELFKITQSDLKSNESIEPKPKRFMNEAKGKVHKIWIDENYYQNGQRGYRIHATVEIFNRQGGEIYLIGAFVTMSVEDPLKDKNNHYVATNTGQIATFTDILKPAYERTYYQDLTMFIPYHELAEGGKSRVKCVVQILDKSNGDVVLVAKKKSKVIKLW